MGSTIPAFWYLPAALLAAIGFFLLCRALWRDRARFPRCPQCWYDFRGISSAPTDHSPLICPECAAAIRSPHQLLRTRRHYSLALLALFLIAPLSILFVYRGDARHLYYSLPPHWSTIQVQHFGAVTFTVQSARDPDLREQRITITHRGITVFSRADAHISLGLEVWNQSLVGKNPIVRGVNQDLNNDGTPEFIIESYSGGAHCCYTIFIFELLPGPDDSPRLIATIDAQNGMGIDAAPADSPFAGQQILNIPDQTFCYWHTSYADSPRPDVYYVIQNHALRIAPQLLSRPPAELESLSSVQSIAALRATFSPTAQQPPTDHWRTMLTLIYADKFEEAMQFLDKTWPANRPGKDDFKKDFLATLESSKQYQDLKSARAAQKQNQPTPPAKVGSAD